MYSAQYRQSKLPQSALHRANNDWQLISNCSCRPAESLLHYKTAPAASHDGAATVALPAVLGQRSDGHGSHVTLPLQQVQLLQDVLKAGPVLWKVRPAAGDQLAEALEGRGGQGCGLVPGGW